MAYSIELLFMFLGSIAAILFRARYYAGSLFALRMFFTDNVARFIIIGLLVLTVQTVIFFQPSFLDGVREMGLVLPSAASSVIGIVISLAVIRFTRTTTGSVNKGAE